LQDFELSLLFSAPTMVHLPVYHIAVIKNKKDKIMTSCHCQHLPRDAGHSRCPVIISRKDITVNTSISDTDYTPSSSSDKIKRLQKYHCRKVMVSQTQISKTKKKKKKHLNYQLSSPKLQSNIISLD